ncbi:MAG: trypsin-like peptidase domain-containing protein [Bacteriovorax sp.]|nr:trypsin-like peptidase domain-containing protein [Bacteriovorax sp.]
MKGSIKKSVMISLFLVLTVNAFAFDRLPELSGNDLIYGNDDRTEIDQYSETSFIEKSQSIALRVPKKRLTTDRNDANRILFPNITLKSAMPQICEDERFIEQVSLGNCSGFLVSPTTLVTAGHCMVNAKECSDNKWVFGFKEGVTELTSSQVYSCKSITTQKYVYSTKEVSDYAVIELDRPVKGYVSLKTRKFGRVLLNTPLVVIGHPMGLTMKATDGAVVSRMNDIERKTKIKSFILRDHYFTANLDSYGGNSGSPVFNKRNGNVEGILVQGALDFVLNSSKGCMESRHLSNSHLNAYETVMRINKVPGL